MSRANRDQGFTLIEVVLTITILGVIAVPLGIFLATFLRSYPQTENRISDSHDMQVATAYFSKDVANAGMRETAPPYKPTLSVWTANSPSPPAPYCGSGAGTLVLLLRWDSWSVTTVNGQTTGNNTPASAAYVNESGSLHRLYCASGAVISSDSTLVHGLSDASVQCPGGCDTATPPAEIDLALTIATGSFDQSTPGTIVLSGHRRQSQ
jgi:prepilin-type N-terminal cleavage/methylation domain-containing protein